MAFLFVFYITWIVSCYACEDNGLKYSLTICRSTYNYILNPIALGYNGSIDSLGTSLFQPLWITFSQKHTRTEANEHSEAISLFKASHTYNISLVLTVLILLTTSMYLAVLRQSAIKISIVLMLLALSHMRCSALFLPQQIVSGPSHTCVLSHNDTVKCWGANGQGQLGYGDRNNRGDAADEMGDYLKPIDLGSNFIPIQLSAGGLHTCILSTNNTMKCFGYAYRGQLGYGDTNNRGDDAGEMGDALKTIDLGTDFIPIQITAGPHHTCALSQKNTVKCFGFNENGQLGYGDTNNRGNGPGQMGDSLNT
eukprot:1045997_1